MIIQVRATKAYPSDPYANDIKGQSYNYLQKAYIKGAEEQREIDIRRAINILKKTGYFVSEDGFSEEALIEQFKQTMMIDL